MKQTPETNTPLLRVEELVTRIFDRDRSGACCRRREL